MSALKLTDIAARIHAHLRRMEHEPPKHKDRLSPYYYPHAERAGAYVGVTYSTTTLHPTMLDRDCATRYLAWLDAGNNGTHRDAGISTAARRAALRAIRGSERVTSSTFPVARGSVAVSTMPDPTDPLAFARALPESDASARVKSWAVALAERAYDAVLEAAVREALAKHPHDRVAAAGYLGMAQQAFTRAADRYGIATTPGKAGRPPRSP